MVNILKSTSDDGEDRLSIKLGHMGVGEKVIITPREVKAEGESQYGPWVLYEVTYHNSPEGELDVGIFPSKKLIPQFAEFEGVRCVIEKEEKKNAKGKTFTNYNMYQEGKKEEDSSPSISIKPSLGKTSTDVDEEELIKALKAASCNLQDWISNFEKNGSDENRAKELFKHYN